MSEGRPHVIGLTGTIGSGKSECARIFREDFGIPVVDADALAYEVCAPGSEGLEAIREAFGDEFVLEDGSYNRKLMGELVARDGKALKRLNSLLHPIIRKRRLEAMEELSESPVIVYDCPLLFEAGEADAVDEVLVVTTDERARLERIMERDGLDEESAKARVAMQMLEREKMDRADTVVFNNGTVEELKAALKDFLKKF